MKRITRLLVAAVVTIALWLVLHFDLLAPHLRLNGPAKLVFDAVSCCAKLADSRIETLIFWISLQLPAYFLIVLGCYALYCVGFALFVFGDPGTAAADLAKVGVRSAYSLNSTVCLYFRVFDALWTIFAGY
jgi:hypothetical protein